MVLTLGQYASILPATVAVLVALGYLVKLARSAARRLDAIDRLTSRELEHNHGTSMKDDVHGIAVALGKVQHQVDDLDAQLAYIDTRLDHTISLAQKHHPETDWNQR